MAQITVRDLALGYDSHVIADKLNFPNPSFFCKFFKREVGITPMEYRNS